MSSRRCSSALATLSAERTMNAVRATPSSPARRVDLGKLGVADADEIIGIFGATAYGQSTMERFHVASTRTQNDQFAGSLLEPLAARAEGHYACSSQEIAPAPRERPGARPT
jgi:hypothetical protein